MANAQHDGNFVPTLLGVSSSDGVTTVPIYADPTSHRLLVNSTGGGGTIGGSIAANQIAFGSGANTIQGTNMATLDTSGNAVLNTVGVGLIPNFTLDVLGSIHSAGANYGDFFLADSTAGQAYLGDITGGFGNNTYIQIDDSLDTITMNSHGNLVAQVSNNIQLGDPNSINTGSYLDIQAGNNVAIFSGTGAGSGGSMGITVNGQSIFNNSTRFNSQLTDHTNSAGVPGSVLTSTGSLINWNATLPVASGGTGSTTLIGAGISKITSGRFTAQTAAKTNIVPFTVGGTDSSFLVWSNVLVTASTANSFTCTCTYTDEGNTSRTLTLNFSQLTGTFITTITNVTGVAPYEGVPVAIRCKAGTTITISTTGTFTTVTYNVESFIQQTN